MLCLMQLRLETVYAPMSPGRGFIAGKVHIPRVFTWSVPALGTFSLAPQEADGSSCHWGACSWPPVWKRNLRCPACFSLEFTQDLPCVRRAGPGGKHASEASSCPVPKSPGRPTDVFKNGLLGQVCAGFLCHQFSKLCFNLACVLLGTREVLSIWLDFWVLYTCPLWRVSSARLVFSVVPLQAVFLHFSSLFINQYLILTLFLPSLC